jgi:prepilin-type N-terminal cleavage/methylation domain-containing protein
MRSFKQAQGYTLIELIVVISLISILLFFSIPRLKQTVLIDSLKATSRWIIGKVQVLRERAVLDQKRYILHVDIDENRLWITDESMPLEEIEAASQQAFDLPADLKIREVEFPDREIISAGRADINFYPRGYSDKAMIHLQNDDGEQRSLLIEPFLTKVKIFETYTGFTD